MKQTRPVLHARDHMQGGADPIPGLLPAVGPIDTTILATVPGAYYKLDEATGVWVDSAGSHDMAYVSRTGTIRGVPSGYDEGDGSRAVTVAGPDAAAALTGSYVGAVADEFFRFGGVASMTVSARVRPTDLSSASTFSFGVCGNADNPGGTTEGWGLYLLSEAFGGDVRGKPCFRRRAAAEDSAVGGTPLVVGEWVRLTGSFDGATLNLYVDDLLAASVAPASPASLPVGGGETDTFFVGSVAIAEGAGGTHAPFQGDIDSVIVWDRALTPAEVGGIIDASREGWVLGIGPDGNPVWLPPVTVTVNGEPQTGSTSPAPTPGPLPTDPNTVFPDDDDWIIDQPFTWNGGEFTVPPKKWTTIPFTDPLLERQSNVTGTGTLWQEIDWNDPAAAGWIDPSTPRVITIPHDMPFFQDGSFWIQVCLKLEIPAVEPDTSYRYLRVFETTHQKALIVAGQIRSFCTFDGGWDELFRDETAHSLTSDGELFAWGDYGGFHDGEHGNIQFVPNTGYAFFRPGLDWLPGHTSNNWTLKKGMRLVPQVWHDATVPLTFDCHGIWPYRPHFVMETIANRAWGPPWSDWPLFVG